MADFFDSLNQFLTKDFVSDLKKILDNPNNFSEDIISYLRKNKFNDAKKEIISRFQDIKEMDLFIKSISNSERSIVR